NVLLKDAKVEDVMSKTVTTVTPETPLMDLVRTMYTTKHLGYPVIENDTIVGMVTLDDVHKISDEQRETGQVKDVMTHEVVTLPPSAPLVDALRVMSTRNIGRIPVVKDGVLVGIVTRTDIMRLMELREG
ncbi:MAG TPA: CBS domain-containing protein, partial [Methanomicrobiales archaeon]|nr:CBS domain-containing protein [Methanomicrobiales archaeon]